MINVVSASGFDVEKIQFSQHYNNRFYTTRTDTLNRFKMSVEKPSTKVKAAE